MQPQSKNDLVYLLTALESIGKVKIYTEKFDHAQAFFQANDQLNFNASLLLIATIGDQISRMSSTTKDKYPDIPWNRIKGMRNRIVHDYSGVDYEIAFLIVKNEIVKLKSNLESLVRNEWQSGTLSGEELEVARNSSWYKHVDFKALLQ